MRSLRLRALFVIGAFVLVLVFAGCGGGNSESAAEQVPPMSKAKLAETLGDICQEHTDHQVIAVEKFDKAHGWPSGVTHEKASDIQLEKELVVVILPIVRDNIHDLKGKLRPSPSQGAKLEAFYEALEHGIEFSEKNPGWINGSPSIEPFMRARNLSWALGTPLCGQA